MVQLVALSLFIGLAVGHFGLKAVTVDGTTQVILFRQNNPKAPALKAPVRAGGTVRFNWTEIIKMHFGPTIAYLGELPTPSTKPTDVNFFKIYEKGYDAQKGKWANEIASDNSDSYTVQIPSDIKSGTYVLRTEIIALHGNANPISSSFLAGPQFYTYCFNVDVVNGGTVEPKGVKIPGAYTKEALRTPIYLPGEHDSAAIVAQGNELNSKYIVPGPLLYSGKYDAPTGSPPLAKETGAYPAELQAKYEAMAKKLAVPTQDLVKYVNTQVWQNGKMNDAGSSGFVAVVSKVVGERNKIINTTEFQELKAAIEKNRT
ncbi:hypothetical protein EJ08DRAFT_703688 [Tothia fuscella]|uniref:AA9 family lytic polysaccharide monooxygenase n=1 Tax=Tothia fuscella TaxID=1048955 RepID=A0A9P4NE86_9PEZI|nr:hypothetical protein EJ08DRAFT_703688 [Tothia fuscella]